VSHIRTRHGLVTIQIGGSRALALTGAIYRVSPHLWPTSHGTPIPRAGVKLADLPVGNGHMRPLWVWLLGGRAYLSAWWFSGFAAVSPAAVLNVVLGLYFVVRVCVWPASMEVVQRAG
jgi:hypothetical protein